jgi:peroxiredoxin
MNTQILAVSVDPAQGEAGQLAFAEQWGLTFPLIPDSARKLSMQYGAAQSATDLAGRQSVLIDKFGIVRLIDLDVNVESHGTDMVDRMRALRIQ